MTPLVSRVTCRCSNSRCHLWSERANKTGALTLAAYREMGGLGKAIISRAEDLYARLQLDEKEAMPGVFAALVQVGESRTDLRRRAQLSELSEAGQAVARRLADEQLLVTNRDWTSGDELVEVAHEALLRHWPRFEKWIEDRRSALLTIRQMQADTRTWLEKRKNASYQWSYERVREAVAALKQVGHEVVLSAGEREFLGPIDPNAMLAELARPETNHRRRALIGERIDVLGDPRASVGVDANDTPEIEWCAVPGGEVTIDGALKKAGRRLPHCAVPDHGRAVSRLSGCCGWLARSGLVGGWPLPRFRRQELQLWRLRQPSHGAIGAAMAAFGAMRSADRNTRGCAPSRMTQSGHHQARSNWSRAG